jgi:phosphatidylinositol alpha-mannosyltransferase
VHDVLDRERFGVLHFHEPFVPFLSLVVLGLSNSVNVATFHAFGGFSPAYQVGSRLMRPSVGRIHGRIAVSAVARHFVERFFPGDYKVIPNGVDIGRFERAVPIARWQDGTKNILFVGRFEARKGLLDLLKAYRILRKTGCECRLLVVGGGPQDKEARRYLATRKLGGVEFLGRVSDDERDALFKTADVYCSPATGRESFGIVLLEAMAAGTAIVCSDIHGYKGVVRRDRDAILVPPGDSKALAGALAQLLSDDERRRAMGRSGRERAEEYSWERVTAKVEDYYGFVIRRLAAQGRLPEDFHAEIPASPRLPAIVA